MVPGCDNFFDADSSRVPRSFDQELSPLLAGSPLRWNNKRGMAMNGAENVDDAERFREYAAECRRLAQKAAVKDKTVLLEIATAWIACADEAERKANKAALRT
jgi:hypothetical protein